MNLDANHAPADPLLGQLQRGRGAGFLAALHEPPVRVRQLLLECITRDPRLDHQIESRAGYYAQLALHVRLGLDPLAEHLRVHDDKDQGRWNTSLTVETLGGLARWGHSDAVAILRDYVGWGEWWEWALDCLVAVGKRGAWEGLDKALVERCERDQEFPAKLRWSAQDLEPWGTWSRENGKLGRILRDLAAGAERLPEPDWEGALDGTVAGIFRAAEQGPRACHGLRKLLVTLVRPEDEEFLATQVSFSEPARSGLALAGIAKLANPARFDWLASLWRPGVEMPGPICWWAERAMVVMPPAQTLPLARKWLNHPEYHLRGLAEELMSHHATREDVPLLRAALAEALVDDAEHKYRICSLTSAFSRVAQIGPVPELERVFVEFRYSYGRIRAAEALRETDRERFAQGYARECLWDCEPETRELGCESADPDDAGVAQRLAELAGDPVEEKAVRESASRRLIQRA